MLVDNIVFHSKKEATRYKQLNLLQKAREISGLELQPKFILQPSFVRDGLLEREIVYIADFKYFDNRKRKRIVEDVKGIRTKDYIIKRKMFLFRYPTLIHFET